MILPILDARVRDDEGPDASVAREAGRDAAVRRARASGDTRG
jgi:hypothetical protein